MSRSMPRRLRGALQRRFPSALAILMCGALACASSTPPSELGSSAATIYGRVTTEGGAAVAGATVRGQAWSQSSCGSGIPTGAGQPDIVQTDDTGYYRQKLRAAIVDRYCITVDIQPPSGLAVDSATVSGMLLDFKDSRDVPYDSVRVDAVLAPSP